MDYKQFLETVEAGLRTKLGEKVTIDRNQILKNNVKKNVLTIQVGQEGTAPCIPIESLYAMYQEGEQLEEIIDQIVKIVETRPNLQDLYINKITEWDHIKKLVEARIINAQKNVELLYDIPNEEFLDCAVVYYLNIDNIVEGDCHASIKITNQNLDAWGISITELDNCARKNYLERGTTFQSMEEVIGELLKVDTKEDIIVEEGNSSMYVLSNRDHQYGAIAIRDNEVLQSIHKKLEDEFYILPSSIHELIIVPYKMAIGVQELKEMVESINTTEVSEEDVLSNSIYYYDGKQVSMVA